MRSTTGSLATFLFAAGLSVVNVEAQPAQAVVGPLDGARQGTEGESLTFSVIVDAPDGKPADFQWDFGDGRTIGGPGMSAVAHEYVQGDSTYELQVRVTTSGGAPVTRTMMVTILNGAPRILSLAVEPDPQLGSPVQFWAETEDPGTDTLEYEWDFGDGSPPVIARDRRRLSHRFSANGRYDVKLTVRDEAASAVSTVSVHVGVDFVGILTGSLADSITGTTGPASFFSGMMATIGGIPTHSVGRITSDQCVIVMGFWDDSRRIHVNVTWLPPPDQIFQPGPYRVGNSTRDAPAPGTAQAQVHVMRDDATYQRARSEAETAEASANPVVAMGRVARNFLDFARGGNTNNGLLYTVGGSFRILRASESAISGQMAVRLTGAGPGGATTGAMAGRFTWRPMVESTRTALAGCAQQRPFSVASHVPEVEKKGVDFLSAGIQITFTRRYKPGTVTDRNVQIGTVDGSGTFLPIAGRLTLDTDSRTVAFQPNDPLTAGIYYEVRIRGGANGVLGEQDEPLGEDYAWRFATGLRAVPLARGGR
jgi:hypothetical protein